MARGRPRKNAVEALPSEEDNQPQVQIREVKHKTEWVELRPVEEAPEDADTEFEDAEIEDRQPRRKTPKNERDELRKKLAANNVTPASNLKLTIEKYSHSEIMDGAGGMSGDTEHCTKYPCVESHITNEDYLDVARSKWGAGMYRFTLRMQNKIVTAWDKRISAGSSGPVIQHVNPNDPTSPQVVVQSNGDGQQQAFQPMSMKDMMKAQRESLKEELEFRRLLMESYGMAPNQQPQQQQRSEEEIIASAIVKHPDVIENVVGSIIKSVGGKGRGEDPPWYAKPIEDAITTGQLAPTVQAIVKGLFPNGLFGGFSNLFGGQQNGQAQMAQTQFSQSQPPGAETNNHPQAGQETLAGNQSSLQPATITDGQSDSANTQTTQQITPEQHALTRLIQNCQRNVPVQVAYQQLVGYADVVEEQAPDYSIYGYIDLLGTMTTDQVLDFVKTLPGGEQIASLPHAQQWTADLQKLIQESQEGQE